MAKLTAPGIGRTSFNCPHCGTLTQQFWSSMHDNRLKKDEMPVISKQGDDNSWISKIENEQTRMKAMEWVTKLATGKVFRDKVSTVYLESRIWNLHLSRCYNCDEFSVWVANSLIWPNYGDVPEPNADLPDDIRFDYLEAGKILSASPRGAAALLRLAVQKICKHLGEKGENINTDIGNLVKKGLDIRVQQALDVVRVVGNNAVHPGQIDLRDDRDTAEKLFGLVNLIADILISQPKHVAAMFEKLPERVKAGVQLRDRTKTD